ncbi:hypothetical protein NDU88_007124 [Pleurodeles waltl]|uniref:Uncharacterized protein n=1 Tax=Pleurodeles waltl TaxID=8319 RepID=A0AAV7ME88_PLEWA|nr:hypothetical protein NDU88_007124 [Pleurodeles waltl]
MHLPPCRKTSRYVPLFPPQFVTSIRTFCCHGYLSAASSDLCRHHGSCSSAAQVCLRVPDAAGRVYCLCGRVQTARSPSVRLWCFHSFGAPFPHLSLPQLSQRLSLTQAAAILAIPSAVQACLQFLTYHGLRDDCQRVSDALVAVEAGAVLMWPAGVLFLQDYWLWGLDRAEGLRLSPLFPSPVRPQPWIIVLMLYKII